MNKQDAIAFIREKVSCDGESPEYGVDFGKLEEAGFKIEEYEQEGGTDEGSHYHVVLKLSKDGEDTFVKCDGYYQSYEGTNWEGADVYEAKPIEVKVSQWAKA